MFLGGNARSLAKLWVLNLLCAEMLGNGIDVTMASETHLKDRYKEQLCRTETFQTFRKDVHVQERDVVKLPSTFSANEVMVYVVALHHPTTPIYS